MTTWNPSDADAHFVFSGGNLIATGSVGLAAFKSCRATVGKSAGKLYFEVKVNIVGASQTGFGLGLASAALTTYIGAGTNNGFSFFSGGNLFVNAGSSSLTLGYVAGTTIGCAVDITNGLVWFKELGPASTSNWNVQSGGSNDPATGVGGRSFTASGAIFPSLSFGSTTDQATGNFTGPFVGTVPTGFTAWDSGASGSGTSALVRPTDAGAGVLKYSGSGASALVRPTDAGSGLLKYSGSGASTLARPTDAGAGILKYSGSGASALARPTDAGSGLLKYSGSGTSALVRPTDAGSGKLVETGSGASALARPTSAGAGVYSPGVSGSGTSTLHALADAGSGHLAVSGSGASTLHAVNDNGAGHLAVSGAGTSALARPTSAGAGQLDEHGAGGSALPLLVSAGTGTVPIFAAGASTLTLMTSAGAGSLTLFGGEAVKVLVNNFVRVRSLANDDDRARTFVNAVNRLRGL